MSLKDLASPWLLVAVLCGCSAWPTPELPPQVVRAAEGLYEAQLEQCLILADDRREAEMCGEVVRRNWEPMRSLLEPEE